jgi:hypothetical protein
MMRLLRLNAAPKTGVALSPEGVATERFISCVGEFATLRSPIRANSSEPATPILLALRCVGLTGARGRRSRSTANR